MNDMSLSFRHYLIHNKTTCFVFKNCNTLYITLVVINCHCHCHIEVCISKSLQQYTDSQLLCSKCTVI